MGRVTYTIILPEASSLLKPGRHGPYFCHTVCRKLTTEQWVAIVRDVWWWACLAMKWKLHPCMSLVDQQPWRIKANNKWMKDLFYNKIHQMETKSFSCRVRYKRTQKTKELDRLSSERFNVRKIYGGVGIMHMKWPGSKAPQFGKLVGLPVANY